MLTDYLKKLEEYLNADQEISRRLEGFKTFSGPPDGHYRRAREQGGSAAARAVRCYPFGGTSRLEDGEMIGMRLRRVKDASSFVISLTGPDALSSIASVAATLGNVGPGLGMVGPTSNYASLHYSAKVILSVLMWFGRLEIFTCLIFLNPSLYRRRY